MRRITSQAELEALPQDSVVGRKGYVYQRWIADNEAIKENEMSKHQYKVGEILNHRFFGEVIITALADSTDGVYHANRTEDGGNTWGVSESCLSQLESVGRHSREYLWTRTDVIVLGNKDPERGGIPGTFWRVPTDGESWDLVIAAGGPGAIASGTDFDNTMTP